MQANCAGYRYSPGFLPTTFWSIFMTLLLSHLPNRTSFARGLFFAVLLSIISMVAGVPGFARFEATVANGDHTVCQLDSCTVSNPSEATGSETAINLFKLCQQRQLLKDSISKTPTWFVSFLQWNRETRKASPTTSHPSRQSLLCVWLI